MRTLTISTSIFVIALMAGCQQFIEEEAPDAGVSKLDGSSGEYSGEHLGPDAGEERDGGSQGDGGSQTAPDSGEPADAGYSALVDITFLWSFQGQTCQETPEVRWVRITLSGPSGPETLANGGTYPCEFDGIELKDFEPGYYAYVLEGLDSNGVVIYRASATVLVSEEDATIEADLVVVEQA